VGGDGSGRCNEENTQTVWLNKWPLSELGGRQMPLGLHTITDWVNNLGYTAEIGFILGALSRNLIQYGALNGRILHHRGLVWLAHRGYETRAFRWQVACSVRTIPIIGADWIRDCRKRSCTLSS